MDKTEQITKYQHWLPKFYLKGFLDKSIKNGKPTFWVYAVKNIISKSLLPQNKTPKTFASEELFYETKDLPINTIENLLQTVENQFTSILHTKILKQIVLTSEDTHWVSLFISAFEIRTPSTKKHLEKEFNEVLSQVKSLENQYLDGKESELGKNIKNDIGNNNIFTTQLLTALNINRWDKASFLFLSIQEKSGYHFITSSNPTSLYDMTYLNGFYGVNPQSPTVEFTIPLSPKLALMVNNAGQEGYKDISFHPNYIEEINNRALIQSSEFIISSTKLDINFFDRILRRHRQSILLLNARDDFIVEKEKQKSPYSIKLIYNFKEKTSEEVVK